METITVNCQVISSDFTWWNKTKRFGRSLPLKAKSFWQTAREKIGEAIGALATFIERCNNCAATATDIFKDVKEEANMGLMQFFFGPPATTQAGNSDYVTFESHNTADAMMGAIRQQNGFVSEEQLDQFQEIGTNIEANAKRLHQALEIIKKSSGTETASAKEIYSVMHLLEKNAFKRSEYQTKRREESQILQEKYNNLRKGLL